MINPGLREINAYFITPFSSKSSAKLCHDLVDVAISSIFSLNIGGDS